LTEEINALLKAEKKESENHKHVGLKVHLKMSPGDEEWIIFNLSEFEIDRLHEILHRETDISRTEWIEKEKLAEYFYDLAHSDPTPYEFKECWKEYKEFEEKKDSGGEIDEPIRHIYQTNKNEFFIDENEKDPEPSQTCEIKNGCISYSEQNPICNETPEICGWNKLKEKASGKKDISQKWKNTLISPDNICEWVNDINKKYKTDKGYKEKVIKNFILDRLNDIQFSHSVEFRLSHEKGVIYASNEEFNLNSYGSNYKDLEADLYSRILTTIELFSNLDTKDKFSENSKEYRENFLKTFKISRFKEYEDRIQHFKEVYGKDWELYANADKEEATSEK